MIYIIAEGLISSVINPKYLLIQQEDNNDSEDRKMLFYELGVS